MGALRWDCRSQSTVGVNPRGIINLRYRRAHDEIAMDRSRRPSCDQQKFWCASPHSICRSRANRASGVLEYSMVSGRHPNASVASERAQIASVHRDIRRINADLIGMEEVRDFDNATIAVSPSPASRLTLFRIFRREKVRMSDSRSQLPVVSRR